MYTFFFKFTLQCKQLKLVGLDIGIKVKLKMFTNVNFHHAREVVCKFIAQNSKCLQLSVWSFVSLVGFIFTIKP